MSISDPIANLITSIKNASLVEKDVVLVDYSKYHTNILEALKKERVIISYSQKTVDDFPKLEIKINDRFKNFKRISKPGRRLYSKSRLMPTKKESIIVVSTSKGLMNSRQAKREHLGGELLMEVY